jgi:hypothetical protein
LTGSWEHGERDHSWRLDPYARWGCDLPGAWRAVEGQQDNAPAQLEFHAAETLPPPSDLDFCGKRPNWPCGFWASGWSHVAVDHVSPMQRFTKKSPGTYKLTPLLRRGRGVLRSGPPKAERNACLQAIGCSDGQPPGATTQGGPTRWLLPLGERPLVRSEPLHSPAWPTTNVFPAAQQ